MWRTGAPRGSSVRDIGEILIEAGALPETGVMGLVDGAALFRLAAGYLGQAQRLKFGEYALPAGGSIEDLVALIASGPNVQHFFTVPEGVTSHVIVERLMADERLAGEIPEAPTEGSLLPETYDIRRGENRRSVIERMQAAMTRALGEAWQGRAPDLPIESKEELLILASIVEKESRPREHGKVASVFVNRLRRGMKLGADPTVIYGITQGKAPLGRGLKRSELDERTPYNTYVIDGLPPTPIANPGRASIRAAANPEETEYLYFVADGEGGHAFAKTLDGHNRNVAAWRRIERARRAQPTDPSTPQPTDQ